MLFPEKHAVV
jgi:hypothetical protein